MGFTVARHTAMARRAYETSAKSTGTPRSVEYQLFSRLTGALTTAEETKSENYLSYVNALSRNLEFWTIIGADVSSDDNALPAALRGQIFYLFEFTQQHTQRILSGDKTINAEPLIDINKNVMSGLNAFGGE